MPIGPSPARNAVGNNADGMDGSSNIDADADDDAGSNIDDGRSNSDDARSNDDDAGIDDPHAQLYDVHGCARNDAGSDDQRAQFKYDAYSSAWNDAGSDDRDDDSSARREAGSDYGNDAGSDDKDPSSAGLDSAGTCGNDAVPHHSGDNSHRWHLVQEHPRLGLLAVGVDHCVGAARAHADAAFIRRRRRLRGSRAPLRALSACQLFGAPAGPAIEGACLCVKKKQTYKKERERERATSSNPRRTTPRFIDFQKGKTNI